MAEREDEQSKQPAPWEPVEWQRSEHPTMELPPSNKDDSADLTAPQAPPADTDEPPVERAAVRTTLIARINGVLLPLLLLIAGYALVRDVDASQADALGLIELMPPAFFLINALLSTSFLLRLRRRNVDTLALIVHVIVLILLLHGIVGWIEQFPRFAVSFTHQGLTEAIQRNGRTLPELDARMNWPGFFTMSALLNAMGGVANLKPYLLLAPVVINFMYFPALYALAATITRDRRVPWLVVWLYFSIAWIGQDYYSPQGTNFFLYLVFVTIVLHYFRTDHADFPAVFQPITNFITLIIRRIARRQELIPGPAPVARTTSTQRVFLVSSLVLIYSASVMSHQLTPVFMLLLIVALALLRRTALRGFHTLMIVLFLGYLSFGAIGYWSGHMSELFGGAGKLGSMLNDNVASKVGKRTLHEFVIYGRLLLAAAFWGTALFGLLRRIRHGRSDLVALIGFCIPFGVLGGQSYGGEAILRVFLFSAPFAAMLCVFALFPTAKTPMDTRRTLIAIGISIALVPAYFLARFGNEQFEYISPAEYAGLEKMYEIVPKDATLIGISGNTPWKIRDMERHEYVAINEVYLTGEITSDAVRSTSAPYIDKDPYLVFSRSMLQHIAMETGRDRNWGNVIISELVNSKEYTIVWQNDDFALLRNVNATRNAMQETK